MDKSNYEKHSTQPSQTNKTQNKTAATFLTGYKCNFNVANKNDKIIRKFAKSNSD